MGLIKYCKKLSTNQNEENVKEQVSIKFQDLEKQQSKLNEEYESFLLKNKDESCFELDQLGNDHDIYIVLTKEGCGKTYSWIKKLNDSIEKGEKFIIFKNSLNELENEVANQFNEIFWEKYKKRITIKNPFIYEENRLIGYIAYLSGAKQTTKEFNYSEIKTIIWDDATNESKPNRRSKDWINEFWQLVSTFFKDGSGCKMYILGNLKNYIVRDAKIKIGCFLIESLRISPHDHMRHISVNIINKNGSKQKMKLLYINTRDLYDPENTNTTNILMNIEFPENIPTTSNENVVGEIDFIRSEEKLRSLHTRYKDKDYIIQISKNLSATSEPIYIIKATKLDKYTLSFGIKIFTGEAIISSTHRIVLSPEIHLLWHHLYSILKTKTILYVGDNTYSNIPALIKNNENYIKNFSKK